MMIIPFIIQSKKRGIFHFSLYLLNALYIKNQFLLAFYYSSLPCFQGQNKPLSIYFRFFTFHSCEYDKSSM